MYKSSTEECPNNTLYSYVSKHKNCPIITTNKYKFSIIGINLVNVTVIFIFSSPFFFVYLLMLEMTLEP